MLTVIQDEYERFLEHDGQPIVMLNLLHADGGRERYSDYLSACMVAPAPKLRINVGPLDQGRGRLTRQSSGVARVHYPGLASHPQHELAPANAGRILAP